MSTEPQWEAFLEAAGRGVVFCLAADDDWMTLRDPATNRSAFPVWSDADRARACATEAWDGAEVAPVEVTDWLEFLEDLEAAGDLVALQPDPDGTYVSVEPADLRAELTGLDGGGRN